MSVTAVHTPKAAELIAEQLRLRIVRGELQEGDALPSESELMLQFGVSRPTLREAFRVLESESLIVIRRGAAGGARVRRPTLSVATRYLALLLQVEGTTVADVYDARLVIEPACARILAAHAHEEDLAQLRACISSLDSLIAEAGDGLPEAAAWADSTDQFHKLVLEGSRSQTLALLGNLVTDILRMHRPTMRTTREQQAKVQYGRTVKSYTALVDLIEAGDPEGAEAHWRTHIAAVGHVLFKEDLRARSVVDLY